MTPFVPRSFPPRHLKRRLFAKLLKEATEALKEFSACVAPPFLFPKQIFASLLTMEAMHLLDSQKLDISLKKVIQAPKNKSWVAPIWNYIEALGWASRDIDKRPFSKKQICKIHQIVKKASAPKL